MSRPGHHLRQLAVRVLAPATVQRVVDPVISDWQTEYEEAAAESSGWKRLWAWYSGYGVLLKALAVYGCWQLVAPWHLWSSEERGTLGRMLATAIASTVALVALLAYKPMHDIQVQTGSVALAVTLVPQAIPVAAPIGLLLGILYATRTGQRSRRVTGAAVGAAVAVSVASFILLGTIVPAANHAFRVGAVRALARDVAPPSRSLSPARGPAEMTFAELRRQVDQARQRGMSAEYVRRLDFHLQQRRALAAAAVPLAVFAVGFSTRRRYSLFALSAAGGGITALYYALMQASNSLSVAGMTPALVVWLPHLGVLVVSALLLFRRAQPASVPSDVI